MKNVVGSPARKANFFQRDKQVEKITSRIVDGNNIHIAAPRRIGKTSILFHLLDNKIKNYIYVYVDTEAIDNEQQFYKKILKEILKNDEIKNSDHILQLLKAGNKFLKKIKSLKILGNGIDFQDMEDQIDYKEELENLLSGLDFEDEVKLILMIDEFPQTIQNIIIANNGQTKEAIQFLQSNRDLRLNPDINGTVIFIYTGSIGLNHTVSIIEGSAFINDINSVEIDTLTTEEAKQLLAELLLPKDLKIEDDACDILLNKISWLIPFYVQLAVQEIITIATGKQLVTTEIVERAFENIIAARNNNHFDDYYTRLKKHFKNEDFDYANELLCIAAEKGKFEIAVAFDLMVKHKIKNKYNHILEILMYDGYINNLGNKDVYQFNSPILRMWWQRFICK